MIIMSRWWLPWSDVGLTELSRAGEGAEKREMIFNPEITREAICGLEVSPEQMAEIDKEMEEIEEAASPTLVSSSPGTSAKKKRSRFAIEAPEKILEEALRKEEEVEVSNGRRPSRKARSAGRRKSRGRNKKS